MPWGVAAAAENPWPQITSVAAGSPSVIGGPSNGCIRGTSALPETGRGFVRIRRHRNRHHAHPDTLRLVRHLADAMHRRNGRLIMVGDLSQPRGGPMASSHVSHQNGLDVDIWLTLADSPAQAWRSTPEAHDPPGMLDADGRTPNGHWGDDQQFLIRTAAMHPAVDRVIVNPALKQALCRRDGDAPWLRKLRPWWGHDAHVHVRLKCPPDSPDCRQQPAIAPGSGCGAELDWWFSAEARRPAGSATRPADRPALPASCQAVLEGR
ncbi:penicillin-insensitive murein endopeptidase [Thiohalocapsa marina]|uniref:Penicillin-insensitive murein endopeptidase n=1 Tax=Thiohalocapsa marina TaxID=424902 RepID=A0A5M8FHH0_9GAMM|nr:penicillin-insensitive murein endopeptidase [Thiohalocapsa marina]KAA6184333.1 penicillin-insensitive murein endopeptidase [Thiohalocapsa marina]